MVNVGKLADLSVRHIARYILCDRIRSRGSMRIRFKAKRIWDFNQAVETEPGDHISVV